MLIKLIEFFLIVYCCVYFVAFLICDCDLWLAFLSRVGKKISKFQS